YHNTVVAASTYCEGGKVTEAAVQQVLNVINTRRSTLAKGQQTNGYNGAKLPYGKNIMKVEWSCTLEKTAASFMDGTCNHTPRAPPAGSTLIGNSDYNDILQGGDNDLSTILGALLGTIDHEELSIGSASVTYSTTTGPHLRPYVNLARADVTSIGCVLEHCGTGAEANHSIYCLTDKP
ncbi:SCP-like protein, partial [Oesophagostomum dentatum]